MWQYIEKGTKPGYSEKRTTFSECTWVRGGALQGGEMGDGLEG